MLTVLISFPNLGIFLNPPTTVSIFGLTVHWYGAIISLGFLLAVFYANRRVKQFGLTEDNLLTMLLVAVPLALVCARAYYCVFSWEQFRDDPISCLYIWEGGIAIYGGVLGAILGMWVLCRVKKLKFTAVLDLILTAFLIGQFIGRWGNFMNREAFGAPTDAFLRMVCSIPKPVPGNTTIPPFCMNLCGMWWASCCCISCPESGSTMARWPWAMRPGTAWAGLSLRACGWTACTGVPSGSVRCWRRSLVPQQWRC